MTNQTWTNQSIRAHLGQRGYLEVEKQVTDYGTVTTWEKGEDELTLVEFNNGQPPHLYQDGYAVDPQSIGYRNLNIQNPQ